MRIVGRFTNFVTKNSSRLLSKIDTVLEAVTKSHLLVGQISSAARVFADVSTNTCIRGVSQEVLGFDIFGKVQEGVSTFLGVAENVGNLLSNLANALTNGAFSAVPPALEFIASKFLPSAYCRVRGPIISMYPFSPRYPSLLQSLTVLSLLN